MIRIGHLEDFEAIDAFDPFGGDRKAALASGCCRVAVRDGEVVAYVTFSRDGFIGRPFISFLAVAPDHRRGGVATRLIAAAEQALGPERIFISTDETNHPMQSLLAKLNWTPAGPVAGVNRDGSAELFYYRDV